MKKTFLLIFIMICLFFSFSVFAGGNKDICKLTIENKTGTLVTQVIIGETDSNNKPQTLIRSMENNTSVVMQIKRNILYDVILVNTDEKQYAKKRQTWDAETANIIIERRDLLNASIWDKAKNLIDASVPVLEEAGKAIADSAVKGYRYMKEDEGVKKAIDALGKLTETGLKIGADFIIEAGKITIKVSRQMMERIRQEYMKKLSEEERKLIDEHVEFIITDV